MKCKKCGFDNLEGVSVCGQCGSPLFKKKSCPHCATINKYNADKCKKCGFDFTKKRRFKISNLFVSLLIIVLAVIILFNKKFKNSFYIQIALIVCVVLLIIGLLINSWLFSKKNKMNLKIPELYITNNKIKKMGAFGYIFAILGFLGVIGLVIYNVYFYLIR